MTRDVRQPRDVGESVDEMKVGTADSARPRLHENFVSDDIWNGNVPDFQGFPDFVEDRGIQRLITQSQFRKCGYRFSSAAARRVDATSQIFIVAAEVCEERRCPDRSPFSALDRLVTLSTP